MLAEHYCEMRREGRGALFVCTEDGVYIRHSPTHWLGYPPLLQALGLEVTSVCCGLTPADWSVCC